MEKVKLTQEQADAIERGIKIYGKSRIMNDHALDGWVGNLNDLNGLTKDEIARALYVGYEVVPEFKVGDWVYVEAPKEELPNVYKIMNTERYIVNLDRLYGKHKKSDIRHATPKEIAEEKERRWWVKHGRDVWELKEGDVLKENGGTSHPVVVTRENKTDDGHDRTPSFNFIFTEMDCIKKNFRVVCFAEDRKDA